MYLDASLKKIGTLGAVVFALVAMVYTTNLGKINRFGSTPYFYAIGVGTTYVFQTIAAEIGKAGRAVAAAAAAGESDERAAPEGDARGIPVLTYHRIVTDETDENNVTQTRFRDQMTALRDAGWRAISLDEFERFIRGEIPLPEKSFLLTFDDGTKESFYPVDPILRSLDFSAANFIIKHSSETPESTYYLAPEEIRWMLKTGRWAIGSHSYDGHRPYGTDALGSPGIFFADRIWNRDANRIETNEEFTTRVRSDLERAKRELESEYSVPIKTLAFPLGNETGIEGANNFPEGAAITEKEARTIYDIGFIQTNNQNYTFNFPMHETAHFSPAFASTTGALATNFLVRRIHVDYDWDGPRLLEMMENGRAKQIPFEDDFATNKGWIPTWGSLELGRNNLQLRAEPETSSASTFLDGSALWDNYSFDIAANWQRGFAIVTADVMDSKTYHACAFTDGTVFLQEIAGGTTRTLAETSDPRITYGPNVSIGIRVHGNVIECTWDFESLVESYERSFSGGVGIQAYSEDLGTAELQVSSALARPYEGSTETSANATSTPQ